MEFFARHLWLIPVLPLLAAGLGALLGQSRQRTAIGLSIAAMVGACLLSAGAFLLTLTGPASVGPYRYHHNLTWFESGTAAVQIGWLLDPLSACMLLMITFVGTLIFLFSTGYMAHDARIGRFFCFLSLFAAAMLGVVLSNSLLLLFVCWELVGLASYLLIGFWYDRPAAAAAARKAFLTTRIGDLGFLVGMLWLSAETGTLLFYDNGNGCLEASALTQLVARLTTTGMGVSTAISLLLFCGAAGKSGQVPLHVWLPDAMEGPTPVSALIHAATMVAAGVFLMARVFPLATLGGTPEHPAVTLQVMTWIGALTALFGALTAVAQTDIKRILAYSTVSQLGFMMMGLGAGGPPVGMLHLLTHAFFKALLFLGAGSVIHGCDGEQDIRKMGGLRARMPLTFATYAVGMMALSGVPLVFSGFWSKDAILHALEEWPISKVPFLLGLVTALITAFYMTRQMAYVFFGSDRSAHAHPAHESPRIMTLPLILLAAVTVGLSAVATPFRPWLEEFLAGASGHSPEIPSGTWMVLGLSTLASLAGITLGWRFYGGGKAAGVGVPEPLELRFPRLYRILANRFYFDELYASTAVRGTIAAAWMAAGFDHALGGLYRDVATLLSSAGSWVARMTDQWVINTSFDDGCDGLRTSGRLASRAHDGKPQHYLRALAVGVVLLVLGLAWIARP
jgi:NADH-quinone oxidoreductase subunit L